MEVLNHIVGKKLKIYQDDKYFKFSLESILLPDFVDVHLRDKMILDLCSGNCPIPLLLSLKTNARIYAVELQKKIYELGIKSIEINKKTNQITLINDDVLNLKNKFKGDSFDIITANPPYFQIYEKSLVNSNDIKATARHESNLQLNKLLEMVFYLLKTNGRFYMVHRTERLIEILNLLQKNNLIPKELEFIYPKEKSNSKLFMIKAVKYGKEGLKVRNGVYLHDEDGNYKKEIQKIFQ